VPEGPVTTVALLPPVRLITTPESAGEKLPEILKACELEVKLAVSLEILNVTL
jgi:hypothetical protein